MLCSARRIRENSRQQHTRHSSGIRQHGKSITTKSTMNLSHSFQGWQSHVGHRGVEMTCPAAGGLGVGTATDCCSRAGRPPTSDGRDGSCWLGAASRAPCPSGGGGGEVSNSSGGGVVRGGGRDGGSGVGGYGGSGATIAIGSGVVATVAFGAVGDVTLALSEMLTLTGVNADIERGWQSDDEPGLAICRFRWFRLQRPQAFVWSSWLWAWLLICEGSVCRGPDSGKAAPFSGFGTAALALAKGGHGLLIMPCVASAAALALGLFTPTEPRSVLPPQNASSSPPSTSTSLPASLMQLSTQSKSAPVVATVPAWVPPPCVPKTLTIIQPGDEGACHEVMGKVKEYCELQKSFGPDGDLDLDNFGCSTVQSAIPASPPVCPRIAV